MLAHIYIYYKLFSHIFHVCPYIVHEDFPVVFAGLDVGQEWRDSLPRELDFCHEMTALERAGNKLREAGRGGGLVCWDLKN
jgi:hypothetical protein